MAKVVLIWNEHPVEVVAGFHARAVAKILREKYGHEVIVEKVNPRETVYGLVRHGKPHEVVDKLIDYPSSFEIAEARAKKHGTMAFNFHGYTPFILPRVKPAHKYNVKEAAEGQDHAILTSEIVFFRSKSSKDAYAIEIPGIDEKLPKLKRKPQEKRIAAILNAAWIRIKQRAKNLSQEKFRSRDEMIDSILNATDETYHTTRTRVNHPKQGKYLSLAISEKIAAAIHERLTATHS